MFDLAIEKYVSLATFRRSGVAVRTPVWIAELDGLYYCFSEASAGKVKRLKNNPTIEIAACNFRGVPSGQWRAGRAAVVSADAVVAQAYAALRQKYGWSMKVGDFLAKLSGRYNKRAMIEITLNDDPATTGD